MQCHAQPHAQTNSAINSLSLLLLCRCQLALHCPCAARNASGSSAASCLNGAHRQSTSSLYCRSYPKRHLKKLSAISHLLRYFPSGHGRWRSRCVGGLADAAALLRSTAGDTANLETTIVIIMIFFCALSFLLLTIPLVTLLTITNNHVIFILIFFFH